MLMAHLSLGTWCFCCFPFNSGTSCWK